MRIVSGGQTGVDRAALDVALALRLGCGGWCPAGRRAEDGVIAAHYPLRETPNAAGDQRTVWNVRDSDATLVLLRGKAEGGTARTLAEAGRIGRPHRCVDLDTPVELEELRDWLSQHRIEVLNVAGPRESECPGIQEQAARFLRELLA